jgi:hypothetical protein
MAINRQKISQMTPKGADLASTDLIEVSVQTGAGYETYSITGQEIINSVSVPTPDLQDVTDEGSTTTNPITITGAGTTQNYLDGIYVIAENTNTGTAATLDSAGALLLNNNGNEESSLKNSNVANPGVVLEFPNKATGSYTIATTDEYVPYTGATSDVDLGTHQLDARSIKINGTAGTGHISMKHQSAGITASGSESALGANSTGNPVWKNDGNALDYIELQSNRKTDLTSNSDSYYPTVKAVKTAVDAKVSTGTTISINGTTQDLSANRTYTVSDANLSMTDITTNNVSTTQHGFTPKAPNDAKKYLDGTGAWTSLPIEIQVACSDETTALTTGTAKITFRTPCAITVTAVRASLTTAQASGNIFTVDINEGGTSILSTKLTVDNTEKTSTTAATPPVISDSSLADDAEMTIDIDQIGDGTAKGLKVTIIGTRV